MGDEQVSPQSNLTAENTSTTTNTSSIQGGFRNHHRQKENDLSGLGSLGPAVSAVVLLRNWCRYGLAERVCYHFELMEALMPGNNEDAEDPDVQPETTASESKDQARHSSKKMETLGKPHAVQHSSGCGVVALLECVPALPSHRWTKKQKRAFKAEMRDFNQLAASVWERAQDPLPVDVSTTRPSSARASSTTTACHPNWTCHEPRHLPLRWHTSTKVFFTYEITRMAFCLDASPTLTSTFGFSNHYPRDSCCPIDRLSSMARTFFTALVEPIAAAPWASSWKPEIAVTVLAVYNRGLSGPATGVWRQDKRGGLLRRREGADQRQVGLLVRDFRIKDVQSANLLAQKIEEWALGEVETEIARRLARPLDFHHDFDFEATDDAIDMDRCFSNMHAYDAYDAGTLPLFASSLRDLLDAGDAALSILPSGAKPVVVVATDCRSVMCEGIMDILSDKERVDSALIVLDLSSPTAHGVQQTTEANEAHGSLHLLSYDPTGPIFPMAFQDDSEAVWRVCQATDGFMVDGPLLELAAQTKAGAVDQTSPLAADPFFCFRRHGIKANAIQWYSLLSLSPLSPMSASLQLCGRMPPPGYLQNSPEIQFSTATDQQQQTPWPIQRKASHPTSMSSWDRTSSHSDIRRNPLVNPGAAVAMTDFSGGASRNFAVHTPKTSVRTTFAKYVINPVPVKGLLLLRTKSQFRTEKYGSSTNERDKLSIQFSLPVDLGIVLHYELSYRAWPGHNFMMGSAQIMVEVSGEANVVQMLKNDYLCPEGGRPVGRHSTSLFQQVSIRLCDLLRSIRREDTLQWYLSPLKWTDQLRAPDTPFVKRLGTLTESQRRRHFRVDEFDVVVSGRVPYDHEEVDFLSEFRDSEDGEEELFESILAWATEVVRPRELFVKQAPMTRDGLPAYCMLEVIRCPVASRMFTMSVEFLSGMSTGEQLALVAEIRDRLDRLKGVCVLPKQMGKFLVGVRAMDPGADPDMVLYKQNFLESQHDHMTWDLVKDPELLPLLTRRRTEIGGFLLLESSDKHAFFAKLMPEVREGTAVEDPGDLVQYQLQILQDRVVVDLHMESPGGTFFPSRRSYHHTDSDDSDPQHLSKFHRMVKSLKKRDQECGKALQCRTTLLRVFGRDNHDITMSDGDHKSCVTRLLAYASRYSIKLRFFHENDVANKILQSLTEEMLLAQSMGAKVARLDIDEGIVINDNAPAKWFAAEFDKVTFSMVHLSLCELVCEDPREDSNCSYRDLTFFTISTTDLYNRRDDIADDDSDEGHISEYLCMSEFSDLVHAGHRNNYSSAAYMALSLMAEQAIAGQALRPSDFREAIEPLEFVEVARVAVAGERDNPFKLGQLLERVLHPAIDDSNFLFYHSDGQGKMLLQTDDNDADSVFGAHVVSMVGLEGLHLEDESTRESRELDDVLQNEVDSLDQISEADHAPIHQVSAPIFVRLMIDGQPAFMRRLANIEKSSSIVAAVSVFKQPKSPCLPPSHMHAANEIKLLLDAYVAEQTLERLRYHGAGIEPEDIQVARDCLRKARDVATSTIDVFFYSSDADAMIPASAPAGGGSEVEEGFHLLSLELASCKQILLKVFGVGTFLVVNTENKKHELAYWGLLTIKKARGVIGVVVHHPGGPERTAEAVMALLELISLCCHTVNQFLLLRRLHRNRSASALLIEPDVDLLSVHIDGSAEGATDQFSAGVFACPIVFKTSFDLFHRCAANPTQVARNLEASVLHIFAVSNRRHVFVYKDEDESIFYMVLSASDADGIIELLVHGMKEPGPSVTVQLKKLLQKRLLGIGVDMLSAVLTKNPYYFWRGADISFVRSFEASWAELDDTYVRDHSAQIRMYVFPDHVFDPAIVLLYFRQNLCGKTFFHPLKTSEWTWDDGSEQHEVIPLTSTDLVFYYNNAPSKLNPKVQGQSTLTEMGAAYMRAAGSGIAIVELSLVRTDKSALFHIAVRTGPAQSTSLDSASLRVKLKDDRSDVNSPRNAVHVKITGTAVNKQALHDWVLLTLNQAVVGWSIERHLEREQRGLLKSLPLVRKKFSRFSDAERRSWIDRIAPGLPSLISVLESSSDLPHPGVKKDTHEGVIRSSTVASFAMDLVEKAILEQLKSATKQRFTFGGDLIVVRLSRDQKPRRVRLESDPSSNKAVVREYPSTNKGKIIYDTPIDCPEYIFFYRFPEYGNNRENQLPSPSKLFEEVAVDDGTGESKSAVKTLELVQQDNPAPFRRSFGFVFSVKRNRRVLLTYNWSNALYTETIGKLREKEFLFLSATSQSVETLSRRCLRDLAPPSEIAKNYPAASRGAEKASDKAGRSLPDALDNVERRESQRGEQLGFRSRRVTRPVAIRRPKLVGKSVEGAAIHAVAASRARASTNHFRANPSSTLPTKGVHDEVKKEGKTFDLSKAPLQDGRGRAGRLVGESELSKAKAEYSSVMAFGRQQLLMRSHAIQTASLQLLADRYWPLKRNQLIERSVAEFLTSRGRLTWNDIAEMPPLPIKLMNFFLASFAEAMSAWTQNLTCVAVGGTSTGSKEGRCDSMLLMGEVKRVRTCKCFVAIRLSVRGIRKISSEGWIATLPRSSKTRMKHRHSLLAHFEKDAAGLDKLSSDLHAALRLDSLMFDYAAFISERAMKGVGGQLRYSEVLHLLLQLMARNPLLTQMRTLLSNYKCYQATIVLRSYEDRLIDLYDAPTLFGWLISHTEGRNLVSCGPGGLCFKREIVVRSTHSICFLTCDKNTPDRMQLVVLCRTQGHNLSEFMFREGSNVAITVVNNIAVEFAGLAFQEIHHAAICMRRLYLWGRVSSQNSHDDEPSPSDIAELLKLCLVRPVTYHLKDSSDLNNFLLICKDEVMLDWKRCSTMMENDPGFTPAWPVLEPEQSTDSRLFYLASEDVFILARSNGVGGRVQFHLAELTSDSIRAARAIQKLANFMLHFVWGDLVSP